MGILVQYRFVVESADRKNICKVKMTENVPMSTQEKKSALQIGFLKSTENEIYGIPKSLVIWVSPSNMASKWNREAGKNSAEFT